jgi:hypothetical protein
VVLRGCHVSRAPKVGEITRQRRVKPRHMRDDHRTVPCKTTFLGAVRLLSGVNVALRAQLPSGRSQQVCACTAARHRPSHAWDVGAHPAGGVSELRGLSIARLGGGQRVVMNTEPRGREVAARRGWGAGGSPSSNGLD